MTVSFSATKEEAALIRQIVDRALIESGVDLDRASLEMDITACHANGCPLRLQDLLDADVFNFSHDVAGISRHMDRETGQLQDFFRPRFAQPTADRKSA